MNKIMSIVTKHSKNSKKKKKKSSHTVLSGPSFKAKPPKIYKRLSVDLVLSTPLTPTGYDVFEVLLWFFLKFPRVYVSQGKLANILGVSRETVNRLTSELQRMGWLSKKQYGVSAPCVWGLNHFFRSPVNLEKLSSIFKKDVEHYIRLTMCVFSLQSEYVTLDHTTHLQTVKNSNFGIKYLTKRECALLAIDRPPPDCKKMYKKFKKRGNSRHGY